MTNLVGGILLATVVLGLVRAVQYGQAGDTTLSVVALVCAVVAAFAWGWLNRDGGHR